MRTSTSQSTIISAEAAAAPIPSSNQGEPVTSRSYVRGDR
jgi:hypothetical protein